MKKKIKNSTDPSREKFYFNSDQQVITFKMFKLFFDNIELEDTSMKRAPLPFEFEDYNLISPDYT